MMTMSKTAKILLGLATVWPLVYMFVFVVWFFGLFLAISPGHSTGSVIERGLSRRNSNAPV